MNQPLSPEALFRKAVVAAWERIPVADRPWNQRVADALWADDRFKEAMREYVIRAEAAKPARYEMLPPTADCEPGFYCPFTNNGAYHGVCLWHEGPERTCTCDGRTLHVA